MTQHTKNLTGMYFGKLKAVKPLDKRARNGSVVWLCECECGNTVEIDCRRLLHNSITSCGCDRVKKLYDPETDCNCWRPATADCRACEETFCITRGYCKFYKKGETTDNDR